ncbi:MAG: mechanosensitive ion channel family protein, partial [Nostocales cyanobacterium ELA583]
LIQTIREKFSQMNTEELIQKLWAQLSQMNTAQLILISLLITILGTGILYVFLSWILRPIFRKFESDIAIVSLNISVDPILIIFAIFSVKATFDRLAAVKIFPVIEQILTIIIIITISSWSVQIFDKVFIYYLKQYTQKTEAMWDDVLLPLLSAVVPPLIYITGAVFLISSLGVDLTGIWVALGGVTFVLGFALQDILANFFSGIVLLIDTPFQFGDILLLEDGSIGMLRRIGIRVTHLYIFSNHCDVYIPNSMLQAQKITNLSRPTSMYYQSILIEIPSECQMEESKKLMEEVVLAHPDTLGAIDIKLEVIDEYYSSKENNPDLMKQQELGKLRLLAEQEVDVKLEEITQSLEALVVTIQFAEKGGMNQEEVENIQQEFQEILILVGFQLLEDTSNNSSGVNFEEYNQEGMIELIREWYRLWIKDPNLLSEDESFISEQWERKINLLKRRFQRLSQKISNPQADETRLDDYCTELIQWLKGKLKAPQKRWQEPQIRMIGMNHDETGYFLELEITFFVDEMTLEEGKRGDRVRSQIYEEIFSHFSNTYLNWDGIKENNSDQSHSKVLTAEDHNGIRVNGRSAESHRL